MTGPAEEPPASSTTAKARKVDPETLVLRGQPGRGIRFRRGVIVAMGVAGSAAVLAIAWLALRPASLTSAAPPEDWPDLSAAVQADALAEAPRDYGEVPKLGPPLPGDLGGPILEQQRQFVASAANDPAAEAERRAAEESERRRQRIESEQLAARQSGLMIEVAARSRADAPPPAFDAAASIAPPARPEAGDGGADQARAPGQQRRLDAGDVSAHTLTDPPSPWTLSSGTVIAASLITGLNSDLPGFVTAQVTANVYDSLTGRTLLVPQGSRLIGSYDSVVAFGQSRALVVWQRIVLPDGSSIRIDNLPATDAQGHAGLSDRIDRHSWQLLKGVVLSTLLGVGTELSFGSTESDLVRAIRESAQQGGLPAGDQLVTRQLGVQPTLRVRPGWPLRVVVHQDIVLRPWKSMEQLP